MGEVVVGISGASGAVYGKRLVEVLTSKDIPVRLVVTNAGEITLKHECNTTKEILAEETGALLENDKNIGANLLLAQQTLTQLCFAPALEQHLANLALESVIISSLVRQ